MSSIVDINTSEARVNLDRPKLTQNSASNNAYSFPMNIPANFISTDKSKDSHISSLEKQLAEAKASCFKLETKNDEQSHIIVSMKQMISKTIKSEDQYLKIAIKKNVKLSERLNTYKKATETLQKDGSHFDRIADFWGEEF